MSTIWSFCRSEISHKLAFAIRAALVGAVGGLLFGYDLGIISGVLTDITDEFELSHVQTEMLVGIQAAGSITGACVGGDICNRVGRRRTVGVCCLIFSIGACIQFFARDIAMLCLGRLVVGIGVSFSSIVDVSYLSEISPMEYKGIWDHNLYI